MFAIVSSGKPWTLKSSEGVRFQSIYYDKGRSILGWNNNNTVLAESTGYNYSHLQLVCIDDNSQDFIVINETSVKIESGLLAFCDVYYDFERENFTNTVISDSSDNGTQYNGKNMSTRYNTSHSKRGSFCAFFALKGTIKIPDYKLEKKRFSVTFWIKPWSKDIRDDVVLVHQPNIWSVMLKEGRLYAHIFDNRVIHSTKNLSAYTYHYCTLTFNGKYMKMYINGELQGNPVLVPNPLRDRDYNDIYIGSYWGCSKKYYGMMDDFRIFRKALSQKEIIALMKEEI
jgi:hypothetical protein